MKKIFASTFIILAIVIRVYGQKPYNNNDITFYYDYKIIDTSNVYGGFYNVGLTDYPHYISWRLIDPAIITFGYGLHVIGKINDYPHLAISQWRSAYSPGPIINGQAAMLIHPEDSLRYRIYKLSKGDDNSNPDYAEWPIDFGAPVNELGYPLIYGDQTLWTTYNSMDSTTEYRTLWNGQRDSLPIMPIEVQQLIYSRSGYSSDYENIFSNTMFFEFKILNKGIQTIDSTFIGFWTDIDFCNANSNPPAVDTTLQTGYCWTNSDLVCDTPPAIGYTLLYGPLQESQGDTAYFGSQRMANYKNSRMSSFYPVAQDAHPYFDAYYTLEGAWNIARGLYENEEPIINPLTNQITKFPLDGDPVTNEGWVWTNNYTNGEAGFYIFTGPFTLAPNDSQWIMLALAPALGRDNLESILLMRKKIQTLRNIPYDSLAFGSSPIFITSVDEPNSITIPGEFNLHQNYPNPFNPQTTIEYEVPEKSFVTIKIYDILGREVRTLINNEEKVRWEYKVEFDATNLASGVYFYRIQANPVSGAGGFTVTKKMVVLK